MTSEEDTSSIKEELLERLHAPNDFDSFNKDLHEYADLIGCSIDNDELEAVRAMQERWEVFYCPCRNISAIKEGKRHIFLCPCSMHLKDIKNNGECFCKLFKKLALNAFGVPYSEMELEALEDRDNSLL